jgi:hypothetical protein
MNWSRKAATCAARRTFAANKKVKFILKPARELAPHDAEVLRLLLNAEAVEVSANYQPAQKHDDRAHRTGRFVPAAGGVD